jgi:hypothetical protein
MRKLEMRSKETVPPLLAVKFDFVESLDNFIQQALRLAVDLAPGRRPGRRARSAVAIDLGPWLGRAV